MSDCSKVHPFLEAFCDEELSPERRLEVLAHLDECEECHGHVLVLGEIKRCLVVEAETALPSDFSARLCARLGEECRREDESARASVLPAETMPKVRALPKHRPLQWKSIAPLAAAAAAVLSFGASQRYEREAALGAAPATVRAGTGQESLVDLLVAHHTRTASPEVTEQSDVRGLEPELGMPIHLPDLNRYGARFVGASRLTIDQARAASFHYNMNGRKVTLYVYDPDDMPLRTVRALHPKVVGNSAVFVGHRRGYSIATCEKGGVGYAVAADLSDDESAELVAAVDR